jgi:hypothetical protein
LVLARVYCTISVMVLIDIAAKGDDAGEPWTDGHGRSDPSSIKIAHLFPFPVTQPVFLFIKRFKFII